MEVRRQAHAFYRCQYHIVITTRYRKKIFKGGVKSYLKLKLLEIRKHYPDIIYIETSIQPDHVHLVMTIPPKYAISTVVQLIKQNTAKALREKFEFTKRVFFGRGGIWSVGYFVSTIGLDEQTVQNYVKRQEREDLGRATLEFR